jgi:hypothetical protein
MPVNRLADYLDPMRQAIADAQSFTEGMAQADFEQDRRTQFDLTPSSATAFRSSTTCSLPPPTPPR